MTRKMFRLVVLFSIAILTMGAPCATPAPFRVGFDMAKECPGGEVQLGWAAELSEEQLQQWISQGALDSGLWKPTTLRLQDAGEEWRDSQGVVNAGPIHTSAWCELIQAHSPPMLLVNRCSTALPGDPWVGPLDRTLNHTFTVDDCSNVAENPFPQE